MGLKTSPSRYGEEMRPGTCAGLFDTKHASRWLGPTLGKIADLHGSRKAGLFCAGVTMMRADDPRISKLIASEQFHHFPGTGITVCAVMLHSGQQTVGYNIAPDNTEIDHVEARKRAREVTRRRVAGLESYRERAERAERDE